jgi:predicted  nucleic acid-binding Zn-ribbon protein
MSEPEISHRCPACGASFRVRAQFCPQCGKPLKKSASDALPAAEASETPRRVSSDKELKTTPLPPVSSVMATPPGAPDAADGNHKRAEQAVAAQDKAPAKKQRVKQAAREMVEENVRPRVEKLRQASNVVLEEASAIDPSLRFVIIAAFLFIIFVVLLLLSFIR